MAYVAQVNIETGFVGAVCELKEPLEPPPEGVLYVALTSLEDRCGQYYYEGGFHQHQQSFVIDIPA